MLIIELPKEIEIKGKPYIIYWDINRPKIRDGFIQNKSKGCFVESLKYGICIS